MAVASSELKADLTSRLRRIEGQVRGVERMLADERECPDILQQMSAIRSAVQQASLILARAYLDSCLSESGSDQRERTLNQVMATLSRLE